MKHWPIYDTLPQYKKLREYQDKVPYEDFDPKTFKDVLLPEELSYVKKLFNEYPTEKIEVQAYSGLGTLHLLLLDHKDNIIKRIEKMASNAVGEELEVLEFGGTRYSPKFGWETKLGPHYDTRPVEMFVFDLQIQSNQDWGLFFEGQRFDLKDNEALLFNGTGQIHWRDGIRLNPDTEIDLIFFWMQHKNPRPLTEQHSKIMSTRQSILLKSVPIMEPLDNSQWWKKIEIVDAEQRHRHYEKISTENRNPLTHNEIYVLPFEDVGQINISKYLNNDVSVVSLSEQTVSVIFNKIKHIHAGFEFALEDCFLINNSKANWQKEIKDYFNNKEIVTFALNINTKSNNILIDNVTFNVDRMTGATFSVTNQNINIEDPEESINLLLFNFTIIDKNKGMV